MVCMMSDMVESSPGEMTAARGERDGSAQFTLRSLLLMKEADKTSYRLPKVNVVSIEDKNNTNLNSSAAALNLNQRINQMKAQKELTSVQMYSQRKVRLKMTQNQRKSAAPWFGSTMVVPQGLGYSFRVRCPVPFKAPSSRSMVLPVDQESIVLGVRTPHHANSSSTPTVPYSTADILYGNDVNKRDAAADELRQNSLGELERGGKDTARQNKSRELEHPNNRRPNSKSGTRRSISIDAVSFDKEPDPLKTIPSSLPPTKTTNHFRPNGIRSNLLKGPGEASYSPKTSNAAVTGRDQDDLIATGTEWGYNNTTKPPQSSSSAQHPGTGPSTSATGGGHQGAAPLSSSTSHPPQHNQQQQQGAGNSSSRLGGGGGNNSNNSYPSKVASSSSSSHQSMSSTTNNAAMVPQRKYGSNNIRPIVVQQNNVSGKKLNNKLEDDPKYTDPMIGAPASFQQRIIELGALEGDTVRWERTKRLKKKKQDRDS